MRHVGRFLAGRLLRSPDPEEIVVELEGEAERPAEPPVAGDDRIVGRGEERAGLDRGGDERRRLAPDHVEVEVNAHEFVRCARRDIDVLALTQGQAGLVVEAHQPEHGRIREAQIGQAVERDSRQAEQRVTGIDRLWDAVDRPEGRPVAAFDVAVLDIVVDQREVVAEFDRRGAGERPLMFARDAGVG